MTEFTFVHAADLHLDAPFRGVRALLQQQAAGTASASAQHLSHLLQQATFIALERLTHLCLEVQADFLVLAGDIYNNTEGSLRARLAMRDAFLRLQEAGISVFLAHGNHDPYTEEDTALPWPENVYVFGAKVASVSAKRGDLPLAIVHGISHTKNKESRNLARQFAGKNTASHEQNMYQLGVLHCALAGQPGAHAAYAPCTLTDLAEAGMDYWALGHVHAWHIMPQHSAALHQYAAYSGSLQGLHVNESGPHGCLVCRVDTQGHTTVEQVTLAPVQWATLTVSLDARQHTAPTSHTLYPTEELTDIPALENFLIDSLENLFPEAPDDSHQKSQQNAASKTSEQPPLLPANVPPEKSHRATSQGASAVNLLPEAVVVRLTLTGRTSLNHELRQPDALLTLQERLSQELEGSGVWLRDLQIATRPFTDIASQSQRADLVGETLRTANAVQENSEALVAFAGTALATLFKNAKNKKLLTPMNSEELMLIAEEAKYLCLDLLEGE